jgi:hypothetical protein
VIKIQKNKSYKQVLEILNFIKLEDYKKVPKELIETLEEYKDDEVDFRYNPEKDYSEQDVSSETKLILAIFFKRYWATETQKEKIRVFEIEKLTAIEEEKKKIFPQNVLSNEQQEELLEEKRKNQIACIKKKNWFFSILDEIKAKFALKS